MDLESQSARSCLFCQEERFLLPSEIEIKKEPGVDDFLLDTQSCDLPSVVKLQLKAIFIVRKLLDIPEEKCVEYLQQNEGKSSPSSWFAVCQSCISSVEDGYKIYHEMKRLERNLEMIKVKLKRLLLTTSQRGDCDGTITGIQRRTRRGKELEKERDFVRSDIRKFVTEANHSVLDGNQQATETPQQQSTEQVELLRWKATNINVTHPQTEEDSDDGADDANDTEWQPVSDGGESADEPIFKQELESDDDNDEDYSYLSTQKRKSNCKRRAKRRVQSIPLSDTVTPLQTNDKPVIRKPVKPIWLHRCKLCVAGFKDRKVIDAHMALHSNNEGILCTQCGWLCSTAKSLKYHCEKHHNKPRRPKEWWRPAPKNIVPKFEYKVKDEMEDIPFYCDHCHMIFITKLRLLRHIENHHSDIEYLPCIICDSKFPTKQILNLHFVEEHQTLLSETKEEEISAEEPQLCEHCPESFLSKMKRDYHIAKFHQDILLTCKLCGHKAKKYCNFVLHKHMKHPEGNEQPLLCEHCHKPFKDKLYLNRHMKIYHYGKLGLDDTLICKKCNVTFVKPSGLKRHLNNGHIKPKMGQCCEYCGKVLPTARDLKRHLLRHTAPKIPKSKPVVQHKRKPQRKRSDVQLSSAATIPSKVKDRPVKSVWLHRCKLCVASFKDRKFMDAHISLHSRNEGISCQQCGWLCSTERTLMNHCVKQHNKVRPPQPWWRPARKNVVPKFEYKPKEDIPYYCDHCHMIFQTKLLLLRHTESYHANVAYLTCTFCDSSFPTKQILELHYRDEHPLSDESKASVESLDEDTQEQSCEFCTESFPSKLKRDLHIAKVHKDMLLTCKICGYKADKYHSLVRHKRAVHKEGKEQYFCEHCARTFCDQKYLNQHLKKAHYTALGIDKPVTCKECNVTFIAPSALQGHINMVHKKIKEHCCEHCGKAFSRVGDLKQHILLHTAPREEQYKKGPFFCQFCPAKFNVRQALYYHMKKHHTDKYEFKCDYCGIGYITQNMLLHHLRNCKEIERTK